MAFEAGYDGFWLARWLRARGIEVYVIHPTSIPVSRAVLGWLRGEPKHCNMVAIPTPRKTRDAHPESARRWCGTKPVL